MSITRSLVYGDTFARRFKVKIRESVDVTDLKELIKKKKQNAFKDIDAGALSLVLDVSPTLGLALGVLLAQLRKLVHSRGYRVRNTLFTPKGM